jgi:antirestriction protein ArdC
VSKVHELITDKIIESIEAGNLPIWVRPWNVEGHKNFNSKRPYRGINRLLLEMYHMAHGYEYNYWVTYNGAKTAGGNVKRGEKSQIVVFYRQIPNKQEEPDEDGNYPTIPLLRYYKIFNLSQCEGIEVPEKELKEFDADERAEGIIDGMPNPPSFKLGGNSAYYSPPKDHVQLPKKQSFKTSDGYYCTAFHELAHSTGHTDRLNRKEVMESDLFGGIEYSKEELTAEISSAMLASHCEFDPSNVERSASYVGSWLKKLEDDKKMVIQAAAKAQQAVDYILGENND